MSEAKTIKGSCLCGAVTISAGEVAPHFGACHCEMCRRWGGGPFFAIGCEGEVEIEGEDSVAIFDSSKWAERGFCKSCGTHLFYRLKQQNRYNLPLGLLGASVEAVFGVQYFIDKKPACYTFADETKVLTEAEIFEMFASKS